MRIRALHIEAFGRLRDLSLEGLPPGMAIFLGQNEAGKSTLLDFFRATLTGYPARTKDPRAKSYVAEGQSGGSLLLDTAQGSFRLSRRPGVANGEGVLTALDGSPIDPALWGRLLGGVTREVYASVYGFSLSELQSFASLDNEGVRHALYGASFGVGLRSPGRAVHSLESEMEKIFRASGSRQPLAQALREWEEVRRQMRECEDEIALFDAHSLELENQRNALEVAREERRDLTLQRRALERRSEVWEKWEAWRLARIRLERMEVVPATFPADGPARLERALDRLSASTREADLASERVDEARSALAACVVDEALAAKAPALRDLAERKASCRNALMELPRLEATLARCHDEQNRLLATLGPDWTAARVRQHECPLHLNEELNHRAEAMRAADAAADNARAALERARSAEAEAVEAEAEAAALVQRLPTPAADLDTEARDRLREAVARLDDATARLPARERVLAQARGEYSRAVSHLHLRSRATTGAGSLSALDELCAAQDEALAKAEKALQAIGASNEVRSRAERSRDAEEQARSRYERLEQQKRGIGDPDRMALENRRTALRRLRDTLTALPLEENRLAEAQEGYAAHLADSPNAGRNLWLIAFGGLLALAGGAGIAALKIWGIQTLPLTPDFSWPLVLWHAYIVLLAGVAFVAAGLPRNKPEAARHAIVAEQLRARVDNAAHKVQSLLEDIMALSAALGLDPPRATGKAPAPWLPDTRDLDACERELERQRDQCAASEHLDLELENHASELAASQAVLQRLKNELAEANNIAQATKRQWHDFISSFGVQNVPAPEAAAAFFARVDSARMTWNAVAELEREVAEMEGRGAQLASLAKDCLPQEIWPSSWKREAEVVAAVRAALESCRLADLAAEERARAAEALRAAEARVARERENVREAENQRDEADARCRASHAAWQELLGQLGLNAALLPDTAREALRCLDRLRSLLADEAHLHDALSQQARERDALLAPLRVLAHDLGRPVDNDPDIQLRLLDILRQEAEAAAEAQADVRHRVARIAELEQDLRTAQAGRDDAARTLASLLQAAQAKDPEDFLRRHALLLERDDLTRRHDDLEDALRLAAADTPFETYLAQFAALDRDDLDARLSLMAGRLSLLDEEDLRLTDAVRRLELRLESLTASDKLASLRRDEAMLSATLRELSLAWARSALARHLVHKARRRFEQERQPEVVRVASSIFSTITNGAWTRIAASLEDRSLRVLPPNGDPLSPELLSRGAQEQLYLSLRLAHIRNHAAQATPLPVIMDDILVNFDADRAARAASVLADLTRPLDASPGHQVLFFTCHPHLAHLLRKATPDSVLYSVERGRIVAA